MALSHYNGGSAVGKWPNVKIIPATYPYVVKVLKKSNELANKAPSLRKKKDLIQAIEKAERRIKREKREKDKQAKANQVNILHQQIFDIDFMYLFLHIRHHVEVEA